MRACQQCGRLTTELECPHDGGPTTPAADVETYAETPVLVAAPPRTLTASLLGTVLLGRYKLERELGVGGFGTVFLATQLAVARPVAIKVLRAELSASADQQRRFRGEAAAISRLQHPNSIRLIDFGAYEDGRLFLVTEFVEGTTLRTALNASGSMKIERACGIVRQILKALDEAHALDIFHRDLKPENVMLQSVRGEVDFVKVLDFGVAKLAQNDGDASTVTGAILGTPRYMAPEQAEGIANARTDLYAVGAIMFELLEGRAPFDAPTNLGYLLKHAIEPIPPMTETPPALESWVASLLAKAPGDRPESAVQALRSLDAILTRAPPLVAPVPDEPAARSAPSSHRATAWAMVALLGIAAAGWSLTRTLEAPEPGASPPSAPATAPIVSNTPPAPAPAPSPPPVPRRPEVGTTALGRRAIEPPPPQAPALSATVLVTSVPAGAVVWQDEKPLGATPRPVPRPTAPTQLTLRLKGFRDAKLELTPTESPERAVTLEAAPKRPQGPSRPPSTSFKPVE